MWVVAVAAAIACNPGAIVPGPRLVATGIEFQPQMAPGRDPQPVVANAREAVEGIDREFGVDLSRNPDVLEYGIARCTEAPSCLGADMGSGPWTVWHIRWQPNADASWIALLFDTATEQFMWMGADVGGA